MRHAPLTDEARRRLLAHVAAGPDLPGVGAYVWLPSEDELHWSPSLVEIYGLERAPRDEADFVALLHPKDRTRMQAEANAILGARDSFDHEFRIVRPDGAVRTIHDRGVVERSPDGAALAVRGINVDVTDARRITPPCTTLPTRDASDPGERRLRGVLDQLFAFVGLLDVDGVLLHANRAPLAAAGLLPEDVGGKPFEMTWGGSHDPVLQVRLRDAIRRAREGERVRFDAVVRMADERPMTIDFQIAPLLDQDGVVDGLIASATDIGDRVAAERALVESEARFRAMTDNLPLIVWLHDAEGRQVFVNETYCRMFGVPREASRGDEWVALTHPADRVAYVDGFRSAVARRESFEGEVRVVRPGGGWRWLRSWAEPRFDACGRYLGHVGASADVTDEKDAHTRLAQSEGLARARKEEIEAISDAAPIGIVLFDTELRFLALNRRLAEVNGVRPEEAIGRPVDEVLGEKTVTALKSIRPRLLAGETVEGLEISLRDERTGRRYTFIVSYVPLRDEAGEVTRFLGTVLDITDR